VNKKKEIEERREVRKTWRNENKRTDGRNVRIREKGKKEK
jgi:hypothetical protein